MKLAVHIREDVRGGYKAVCPSLPGCISRGKTRQEARDKIDDAIRGYIAATTDFVPEQLAQEVLEV